MSEFFETLTGYELAAPAMLLLALLVPLAFLLRRRGRSAAILFAPGPLLEEGLSTYRRARRGFVLPFFLQIVGLLLVVVALARPVEKTELPRLREGIDIVLVLDRSSSMNADDLAPGRRRIEIVRQAAIDFVGSRPEDRIGLVAFARYPDLRSPLTLDHEALVRFIELVEPVTPDGEEDATGIGTATALAARVLERSRETGRSNVIVLLTDGEENVASARTPNEIAPLHAAQLCADLGVRVHVIVAGTGRFEPDGSLVPVDVSQVRRLAQRSGGRFFEASDAAGLRDVYAEIDRLETGALEEPRFRLEDRFLAFLVAGLLAILFGWAASALWMEVLP